MPVRPRSGPFLLDCGVEFGPHHDGETQEEREQQERDRGGQRAIGVTRAGDVLQVDPQAGGRHHEHCGGQDGAPDQPVGRKRLRQRDPVEDRDRHHQREHQHGVVPELQDVLPAVRNELANFLRTQREQRSSRRHEHQHHHVETEGEETLPDRMAQGGLVVGLDYRVHQRRDRRGSGPQADHETQRHHFAAGALHNVAHGRLDQLGDDALGKEGIRGADQLALDGGQGVRAEKRGHIGQAAEHPEQQWRQRQHRPEAHLSRLREDRVVPAFGQRPLGDAPCVVTRRFRRRVRHDMPAFLTITDLRGNRAVAGNQSSSGLISSTAAKAISLDSCSLA